jgi:hypothetical protein
VINAAYLGRNIVSIPEILMITVKLIKEKSADIVFVIHSTHYINNVILCQRNNGSGHISKNTLNSLDGQVTTYQSAESTFQNFKNEKLRQKFPTEF